MGIDEVEWVYIFLYLINWDSQIEVGKIGFLKMHFFVKSVSQHGS